MSNYVKLFIRIHMKFWYLSVASVVWTIVMSGIIQPLMAFALSYMIGDFPAVIVTAVVYPALCTLLLLVPNSIIASEYSAGGSQTMRKLSFLLLNQMLTMLPLIALQSYILLRFYT